MTASHSQAEHQQPSPAEEFARLRADVARLEARGVQLAKANQALMRSLASLSMQPGLDTFIRQAFTEIARCAEADLALLFLFDAPSNTLTLQLRLKAGGSLTLGAAPGDPPSFFGPIDADITPAFGAMRQGRAMIFQTADAPDEISWPETVPWHLELGHTASSGVALIAGEVPIGLLGLAWKDRLALSSEEQELILALANQAALSIQLERLNQRATAEATHSAVLQERARFARELHDTLAQAFTGIVIHQEAAKIFVPPESPAHPHLLDTLELAREGLREARRSVWALRPGGLRPASTDADPNEATPDGDTQTDGAQTNAGQSETSDAPDTQSDESETGATQTDGNRAAGSDGAPNENDAPNALIGALLRLASETSHGLVQVSFDAHDCSFELPSEVESDCLRIAQEAITNALKHAEANQIRLEMRCQGETMSLHIEDNGRGFDAESIPPGSAGEGFDAVRGFGLAGMRERAALHGGELLVSSRIGKGTRISATIPLPRG